MFTTRLVPSEVVTTELLALGREMAARSQLLLPGISFVSTHVPNFSERSKNIPSTWDRLELLQKFGDGGLPVMLALRPTFPFHLVPKDDVRQIIQKASQAAAVVLGEVMILDEGHQMAQRLNMPMTDESDRRSSMTFLDQPAVWKKRTFPEEVRFAATTSNSFGLPYFLRSGPAREYIRDHWDWEHHMMTSGRKPAISDVMTSPDP
ncbi:hypothetical protein ACQPYE_39920 [Actinosynnema sp. CA-299493]